MRSIVRVRHGGLLPAIRVFRRGKDVERQGMTVTIMISRNDVGMIL
jgi:hypothetical protein